MRHSIIWSTRENIRFAIRWGADYNDPMTFMKIFTSDDSNNNPKYSNPEYDELVNACMSETDMKVREEKFAEAEKILLEDAAIAPLNFGLQKNLVQKRLEGVTFSGLGGPDVELKKLISNRVISDLISWRGDR